MKNLLLQHWSGDVPEIVGLSTEAMAAYAARIGADYAFLRGTQFDPRLSPAMQKLAMLSEDYDTSDTVCMVDSDMFPVRGLTESVFDLAGYGIEHPSARARVHRQKPAFLDRGGVFWGGAVYLLPRDIRVRLRAHYAYLWAREFDSRGLGLDEGVMAVLARRTKVPVDGAYFGQEWAWASYADGFSTARMVHVRHHDGKGRLVDKMDVYRALMAKGIL